MKPANLPPLERIGRYRIDASRPGFASKVLEDVPAPSRAVEVVLQRLATLQGTVTDAETGALVEGFRVALLPDQKDLRVADSPNSLRASGRQGAYGPLKVAPGPYRLLIQAPRFLSHESPLVLEPGQARSVSVLLYREESPEGRGEPQGSR